VRRVDEVCTVGQNVGVGKTLEILYSTCSYPKDELTETQQGNIISPRSHLWLEAKPQFRPMTPDCGSGAAPTAPAVRLCLDAVEAGGACVLYRGRVACCGIGRPVC